MNEIKIIVKEAIKKAYPSIKIPDFTVGYANEKFGDFSTNVAMILAKAIGDSPEEIANKIIEKIRINQIIEKAVVAKPGFINFEISLPFWQEKISEILVEKGNYGKSDLGKDLKVNVEFVSANPTGPLTLGNGRGGYCGDVLAKVFAFYGAKVTREYYINDCGRQITILGHSILKDKKAEYKGAYIDEVASKVTATQVDEAGSQAAIIITEEYIKKTIKRMGIKFDHWFSQKELFESGQVSEILSKLKKIKLTYEQDGALWLKTSDFGDDKDRVLVTAEGEHTYFASDIAYHFDKIKRHHKLLIDFWGADHHGYVGRMQAAVEILRQEEKKEAELKILIAQLVRLVSKGQEIKMSKRLGTYVTLDELIDEVGIDVTRFFFLERALNTHMDFDLDLAKEHSQKNPVYYVQYAYARIHSILAKSKSQNLNLKLTKQNLKFLKEPAEIKLIKELVKLPEIVKQIVADYQVQQLPFYATALANAFHYFYESCPVLTSDKEIKIARLELLKATQIVLKNTLDLMGISAPEKM